VNVWLEWAISMGAPDRGLIPRPLFHSRCHWHAAASRTEAVMVWIALYYCFLRQTATVTPFSSMPTQYIIPAGLLATTKLSTTRVRSFLAHVVQIEALKVLRMEEVVRANHVAQRASAAFPIVPTHFRLAGPVRVHDVGTRGQIEIARATVANSRNIAGTMCGHMSADELAGSIRDQAPSNRYKSPQAARRQQQEISPRSGCTRWIHEGQHRQPDRPRTPTKGRAK
jgi:hypothetical protein